jgi:WD40 repeat protein
MLLRTLCRAYVLWLYIRARTATAANTQPSARCSEAAALSGDGSLVAFAESSGDRTTSVSVPTGIASATACGQTTELVAIGGDDGSISVYSTASLECVRTLTGHHSIVSALDSLKMPDKLQLFSGSWDGRCATLLRPCVTNWRTVCVYGTFLPQSHRRYTR